MNEIDIPQDVLENLRKLYQYQRLKQRQMFKYRCTAVCPRDDGTVSIEGPFREKKDALKHYRKAFKQVHGYMPNNKEAYDQASINQRNYAHRQRKKQESNNG